MKTATTKSKFALIFIIPFSFFVIPFSLFTLHASLIFAQVPTVQDCLGAKPICQDAYIEYDSYEGSGHYPNEIYNPGGDCMQDCPGACLDGEQNSVWYIFTVQNSGFLRFSINPAGDDDYDWAVYDITAYECADIYTHNDLVQKSCNAFGYPPNGTTGINSDEGGTTDCNHCGGIGTFIWNADLYVTEGSNYVLVVENWTGMNNGFTIDFSASSAGIFDNRPPGLDTVFTAGLNCGSMEIAAGFSERVMCESVDPSDFLLTGPGGPFNILDVQGETCLLGGEMEKKYTLLLDRQLISDGEYSLFLMPGNDVIDACNNMATADTIAFHLAIGAPVVIDSGIVITAASYGENNGHITGLVVNGHQPLSYLWYDHFNDTIGTGLDLHDVYSGNYFLLVTDTLGCETLAGPYFVDLIEDLAGDPENRSGYISVFPNPNPGKFSISMSKEVVGISIFNMIGNIMYSFHEENLTSGTLILDLSKHGAGVYLIKATLANGTAVTRFVQIY